MEKWQWATLLLCLYGFFREVRPSESFLTQYLEGPWKNLTAEEVNNQVYPVWTYSYLVLLLVTLLITDFLRYKPVIVLEGLAYVVTWILLLWAPGVLAMQFMEFCYGIVTATEVAYYTYIYAKIPKSNYKRATSYTRAASLFGKFLAGTLAQTLVSTDAMDYHQLNYISLASVSVALVLAVCLPPVAVSIYFHQKKELPKKIGSEETEQDVEEIKKDETESVESSTEYERVSCGSAAVVIWRDFKYTYTNVYTIKWCLWWALATCSYEQAGNYIQTLWETIYPSQEHEDIYNGAVDAVNTLLGAIVAMSLGFIGINWDKWGEITLGVVSLIQAGLLLVSAETYNIWIAYVFYGLYTACYYMLITIASFQVAKNLPEDSYGLIFGCNQFFALLLQAIMTVILVDEHCIGAGPRLQFLVYGTYNGIIGLLFMTIAIHTFCKRRRPNSSILSPELITSESPELTTSESPE